MTIKKPVIPQLGSDDLRLKIRHAYLADEAKVIKQMVEQADLSENFRADVSSRAADYVRAIRKSSTPSIMENFLAEYGLSTKEGVALMCLAEALLRVPDSYTIDELIEDKISHGNWGDHLGHSGSPLVNASTWALLLTGKVMAGDDEGKMLFTLQGMVKRLGEPVVRKAVGQSMKEMGRHFVLGTSIEKAIERARTLEAKSYTYSYDMLGEAARTEADARRYHLAYSDAISELSSACKHRDIRENPGISVKLSALHPRYEVAQHEEVMDELVARTASLAMLARSANMGFNIDAEEADRLDLSLDVIEKILSNGALKDWDGFGVVVQAFGKRAPEVLDWLYALAKRLDRKIMVRLVKGAYWDTEVKRAQVLGLSDYPVFTRKTNTDIAYLACSRKLLGMTDRVYPQFATHNAYSVAAVLKIAEAMKIDASQFEFQRLHGMGEALHDFVVTKQNARCRIYAPVGEHQDLLAYLVRRLLENGANSSFVNQIVDTSITPETIARDPVAVWESYSGQVSNPNIPLPADIYGEQRRNSRGWDITDISTLQAVSDKRDTFVQHQWNASPTVKPESAGRERIQIFNPANPGDQVGEVVQASPADADKAVEQAQQVFNSWRSTPAAERADILRRVADLYEANAEELFALLAREAGKSWLDSVGEVREAVDFARYYADQVEHGNNTGEARGVIVCISPWNFPLAIFTGQIMAAIAAGNCVVAKPAEQTSLIAARATALIHESGLPPEVLQLLPGSGAVVGDALTRNPAVSGICFTGSTLTAQRINRNMAGSLPADAPLIAETGGLNAMIVDSTALPEQVVRDVVASAFQSAGQRCSALRMLYVQKDVADKFLEMLFGAMDELRVDDPWYLHTDVGPVIDMAAKDKIDGHCRKMQQEGKLLKQLKTPGSGIYVGPAVIKVDGIEDLEEEIFGPVLHIATFNAEKIDKVVDAINAKGYGLTFGLHTRVDNRVEQIVKRIKVGNIYVNRNQIGAVVGSQPFGGEGLSGTGPKAGGPWYVPRFYRPAVSTYEQGDASVIDDNALQGLVDKALKLPERLDNSATVAKLAKALNVEPVDVPAFDVSELPGPTGETNQWSTHPRGLVLCLGPGREAAIRQMLVALETGNRAVVISDGLDADTKTIQDMKLSVVVAEGSIDPAALAGLSGINAVCSQTTADQMKKHREAMAQRDGELIPLINELNPQRYMMERHLCIDTTAAGGNASLIASSI
jgi:RHH-type proline utilization regulon transcriptional repressor/proline dehydrogenase/delta 1-pyrroline-5-carboxylate dehydrogenase